IVLPCFIALFILLLWTALWYFDVLPVHWNTLLPCPVYYCLLVSDPACLNYELFNKARIWIYHASEESCYRILRLPRDPAAFGTQLKLWIQHYPSSASTKVTSPLKIMSWISVNCHMVAFNDVPLKDIFRVGLNDPIRSWLPGGKIHWTLEQCIDNALLLAGSPFTVGVANEESCYPPLSAKPFSVMSGIIQVGSEPSQAMPAKPKPTCVTSAKPQPAHAMSAPGPAHAMPALPESAPVHKMAAIPKPVHKMAAPSESPGKMAATPEPLHAKIISSESHLT
ncbi:hypothetical protein M9458_035505, partial [Cirrhinus mrigala]